MSTADLEEPKKPRRPEGAAETERGRAAKARLRQVALGVLGLGVVIGAVVSWRAPDPLAGPRPVVAEMTKLPRTLMAYQAFLSKKGRQPSPEELTKAVAKNGGPKVVVVAAGVKKPNALRLAGTKEAPALELLDERGDVATYGDMPVVIQVRVP
jgi:hypothetical protein